MKLCECGCGKEVERNNKYVNYHNLKNRKHSKEEREKSSLTHKKVWEAKRNGTWVPPKSIKCLCGCGKTTKPGRKYVYGHNNFLFFKENPSMRNPETVKKMIDSNKKNGCYEKLRKRNLENNPMKNRDNVEKMRKKLIGKKRPEPYRTEAKGKHHSPATEIKKGQHLSRRTEFKKGHLSPFFDVEFFRKHGTFKSSYPYSIEWTDEFKKEIRKNYNDQCPITKITNSEHKKIYKRSLAVHHGNDDKSETDKYWFIPLDTGLHLSIHASMNYEERLAFIGGYLEDHFKKLGIE